MLAGALEHLEVALHPPSRSAPRKPPSPRWRCPEPGHGGPEQGGRHRSGGLGPGYYRLHVTVVVPPLSTAVGIPEFAELPGSPLAIRVLPCTPGRALATARRLKRLEESATLLSHLVAQATPAPLRSRWPAPACPERDCALHGFLCALSRRAGSEVAVGPEPRDRLGAFLGQLSQRDPFLCPGHLAALVATPCNDPEPPPGDAPEPPVDSAAWAALSPDEIWRANVCCLANPRTFPALIEPTYRPDPPLPLPNAGIPASHAGCRQIPGTSSAPRVLGLEQEVFLALAGLPRGLASLIWYPTYGAHPGTNRAGVLWRLLHSPRWRAFTRQLPESGTDLTADQRSVLTLLDLALRERIAHRSNLAFAQLLDSIPNSLPAEVDHTIIRTCPFCVSLG
ncbi:hypothetical protein PAPYR_6113 [Paratrimastix pyriformis]|uniref:Uncharacterized protein n=1 Tax=Paratrimastix pyriformis TaxID=342808 RepID=A0ABQ8UFW2_9EUKA|nr:hypothetical protein PAPYR_6113 [Paratrimastix pyriformis]